MNDVVDLSENDRSLKTVGHVSYLLHTIVAVGAVIPGFQPGIALLIVAFVIDLVKKHDAAGDLAGIPLRLAHPHRPVGRRPVRHHDSAVVAVRGARHDRVAAHFDLVPLSRGARLGEPQCQQADGGLNMSTETASSARSPPGRSHRKKSTRTTQFLAFHDIHPAAPVHFLIIPKMHVASLLDVTKEEHQDLLGSMLALAPKLAREQGAANGFKTLINTGKDGGQEVYHLHVHVIGGPRPWGRSPGA